MGLMGSYFSKKRAFAIGVATTGNSAGVSSNDNENLKASACLPYTSLIDRSGCTSYLHRQQNKAKKGQSSADSTMQGMIYPVLVQQLLPKIGFAWTARCLGFFNLGLLCIAIAFMRPRLPPRESGPYVDLSAFKEPTYSFLVAGLFFAFWGVYWTFYYVCNRQPIIAMFQRLTFISNSSHRTALMSWGCLSRLRHRSL